MHPAITLDHLIALAREGAVRAHDVAALDADDPALVAAIRSLVAGHAAVRDGGWSARSVYEGARCEVALFALSAGDEIPLHDHPGMTVYLRVLRGAVALDAWDLIAGEAPPYRAVQCSDDVLRPGDEPAVSLPWRANLHGVRALEDAVFVDVLTPPYDEERRCSEWRVETAPDAEGAVHLERVHTY